MSTKKNVNRTSNSTRNPITSTTKTRTTTSKDTKKEQKESKITTPKPRVPRLEITRKKEEEEAKLAAAYSGTVLNKSKTSTRRVVNNAPFKRISTRDGRGDTNTPSTPPSSRVSKSQFFPSKKMYSHALGREASKTDLTNNKPTPRTEMGKVVQEKPQKILREKNTTRNPPKVAPDSSESSSVSERPRTATLRKGSIVNKNIVGPDAPKPKKPINIEIPKTAVNSGEEYADDFDSYESDFEAYNSSSDSPANSSEISAISTSSESEETEPQTAPRRSNSASTDDERKLDSGNFELPDSKHRQILDEIQESTENSRQQNNLGSLSDEGFEEAKSLQFINFLGAQKRYQHRKSIQRIRQRGEEILSMIRLDSYSFTLLDISPVPYEDFIKYFGKSNGIQASVQTGEDNLDEESQTEIITMENKWTQIPRVFPKIPDTENFWAIYREFYSGSGGDSLPEKMHLESKINEQNLENFIQRAGALILNIQAEETEPETEDSGAKSSIPFSKQYTTFDTNKKAFLNNRNLKTVSFVQNNSNKIITVHGAAPQADLPNNLVCLWNICNVNDPDLIFVISGEISCCTVHVDFPNLVFTGLTNGTVALWDSTENLSQHNLVIEGTSTSEILMRSPTYTTEVTTGHLSGIIGVKSIRKVASGSHIFDQTRTTEICSLDDVGELIIWSVIFKNLIQTAVVEKQGLAHWGSVIIVANIRVSLREMCPEMPDLTFNDLALSQDGSGHIYVATSYGVVIHCLANGTRSSFKKFLPNADLQAVNCVETCPYSAQHFVAGFENGDISFYSISMEKPLMVISNKDCPQGKDKIEMIRWSLNKPLLLYAKDVSNSIHVWNLKISDFYPTMSVPFKDKIIAVELSASDLQAGGETDEKTFMLIATAKGLVYVHLLDEEHGKQPASDYDKDKQKFFKYIKI